MTYMIKSVRVYPHIEDDDRESCFDDEPEWNGLTVGVKARALVTLCLAGIPEGIACCQRFDSGGLWGIQVESLKDPYLAEVYEEELDDLFKRLAVFGISREQCTIEPMKVREEA